MKVAQASREGGRGKAEAGSITMHPSEVSLGPGSPATMGLGLPFLQVLGTLFSSITSGICLLQAWLQSGAWAPRHSLPSADPKTCMAGLFCFRNCCENPCDESGLQKAQMWALCKDS